MLFTPTLANFRSVFRYFDLFHLLESSLVISLGSAALSLLIGVPAGYALARSQSSWAIAIAYFFLAVRTVPPVATLLPFYLMMRDIGLLGTWWAVILLGATLNAAFVVWMMFSYFRSLPKEMEEAALTDGCTLFGSFWRVALPLVKPGIVASALLCIMFSWNDFLYSAFLTRAENKPISVALLAAYGTKDITWGTLGALAHFSTIPIVADRAPPQPLLRPGPDPRHALRRVRQRKMSAYPGTAMAFTELISYQAGRIIVPHPHPPCFAWSPSPFR